MNKKKPEDWVPLWPREPARPMLRRGWWDRDPPRPLDLVVVMFLLWIVGLTVWYAVAGAIALLSWIYRVCVY